MITPEAAKRVRLLALDVDGVLTDNGIWIAPLDGKRVEFKRFDIQDGLGLLILRMAGIDIAWVSGRKSEATELRAQELRVATVIQEDKARKLPAMERLLSEKGLGWDELAYVGDDLPDLPILRRAGLPITVANGCPEAKLLARLVTSARGGEGAVREVVEAILRARGSWDETVRKYLAERGESAP